HLWCGAAAEEKPPQRRVLEPEPETLGETVFPRRPNERLAVCQRESLALCTAHKNLSFGGRPSPQERTQLLHDRTLPQLLQLAAQRLDDEVEDGRANFANFAKLPIGQPLPRISDAPDGPVPSARECLLDPLDGSSPVGVPQPFPTGAQSVNCPIPRTRQRLL